MKVRSVIILIVCYGIYLIIGASVFQALEYARENRMCEKTLEDLKKYNISGSNKFFGNIKELIKLLLTASSNGVQFDSTFSPSCAHNWNFENSFFFAGTVITTIECCLGYGNIAPGTWEGRVFCIFYAAVGLPLFGIMFSEIGSIFAGYFRKLERKLRKKIPRSSIRHGCVLLALLSYVTIFFVAIPAWIFVVVEEWNYHEAFYFAFISLTTIGFGDYVAGVNPDFTYNSVYRVCVYFWVLFGLAFMATVIKVVSDVIQASAKEMEEGGRENSDSDAIELKRRKSKTEMNIVQSCINTINDPSQV